MYILLAIIISLLILLFFTIRIAFWYNGKESSLTLQYLFIKVDLLKWEKKRKAKSHKSKDIESEKEKESKDIEPQIKTKDILDYLDKIFSAVKKEFLLFKKHVVFDKIYFSVAFSTGDAAKTAITYGAVCALVYNFFSCFYYNFKIKDKNITIAPFYTEPCFKTSCQCNISIRLIWVFGMAFIVAWAAVDIFSKIKRKHRKIKVGEQI